MTRISSSSPRAAWAFLTLCVYLVPSLAHAQPTGTIVGWGWNAYGQHNIPEPNTDFVSVSAGAVHGLGLKSDGTIVAWGNNFEGQCDVPGPNADFIAVSAGNSHSLGLKSDGSVVAWGYNGYNQCNVPSANVDFVAIAGGGRHSMALKSDGTLKIWGDNEYGQRDIPAPNADFVAISGGERHCLGLKSDGTVVAWGYNAWGQSDVPGPNADFVGISGGGGFSTGAHSLGLKSDGSIVAWGYNGWGQCNVPSPNSDFVAVAAGGQHSVGLKSDGTIVAWGYSGWGLRDVPPADPSFQAITAGGTHNLALKGEPTVPSFCSGTHLSDVAAPNSGVSVRASQCSESLGTYEVTERFAGDTQTLSGVGFWFAMSSGLPADPSFTIRIYITGADGCPDGDPIFTADCDVVEIGPGSGTPTDPVEYFCDFSDNGYGDLPKILGLEYSISIQNTNCPGEGEYAYWVSGDGDGIHGCLRGYDVPSWTRVDDFGAGDRAMYLCNQESPSFCGAAGVSDLAPPVALSIVPASECFLGSGSVEVTERFIGDGRMLGGVGFWIHWWGGFLPTDPRFAIRIYDTDPGGCPDAGPIWVAVCDVVETGPGDGAFWNPIEYFCSFSDNGLGNFLKMDGVEYSISIQSTNCPGEGEKANWISGDGDGVYGCKWSYDNPSWVPATPAMDRAMYLCNEEDPPPPSSVEETAGSSAHFALSHAVPNPSSRSMTYSISLEKTSEVKVAVFDLNGRAVNRTREDLLPAGVHTVTWSPVDDRDDDLPAGVYYLKVDAAGVVKTKKLVVVR